MSKRKKSILDSRLFWPIAAATAIGFGIFIVCVCRKYLDPPKDTEIGLPVMVAYVALLAIIAQIIVNIKQWHVTADGLDQTRELFELAERPSIGIESIGFTADLAIPRLQIVLVNSGRVPAINFEAELLDKEMDPVDGACPDPMAWEGVEQQGPRSREVIGISGKRILPAGKYDRTKQISLARKEIELYIWLKCTYSDPREFKKYRFEYFGKYSADHGVFLSCQNHNFAD